MQHQQPYTNAIQGGVRSLSPLSQQLNNEIGQQTPAYPHNAASPQARGAEIHISSLDNSGSPIKNDSTVLGIQANQNLSSSFVNNPNAIPIEMQQSNLSASMNNGYKNPWTSVSRPMNGFIDINENQWEQNELRKAQLAKDLQAQMAETKAKKDLAKQLALAEEQAIERKLER